MQSLEFRQYLTKTKWIDISKSKVRSIQNKVWRVLSQMDHVDLSGNHLTIFPTFLGRENITFRWLAFQLNPLRCYCEDKWIRGWLQSLGKGLFGPAACGSPDWLKGKNILEMTDKDFCTNPNRERLLLIVEVCDLLARFTAIISLSISINILVTHRGLKILLLSYNLKYTRRPYILK